MSLKGIRSYYPGRRVKVKLQWVARHLDGVIATNSSGSGVTWVRQLGFASLPAVCIESVQGGLGYQHLPPYFEQLGQLAPGSIKDQGQVAHSAQIGGHIFPLHTVSASQPAHKHTVFVDQSRADPIELGFAGPRKGLHFVHAQKSLDLLHKLLDRFHAKEAGNREHRHLMAHLDEALSLGQS